MDGLLSSCYFQILLPLYQSFADYTKSTNYNMYHRPFHVPRFFQFPSKVLVLIPLFAFIFFYILGTFLFSFLLFLYFSSLTSSSSLSNSAIQNSNKYKLATFSIATKPRCRRGRYSIPRIAPLYPWSIPLKSECQERRHQLLLFESLVWLDLGLNSGLPDHWRTLYSLG